MILFYVLVLSNQNYLQYITGHIDLNKAAYQILQTCYKFLEVTVAVQRHVTTPLK